MKEQHFFTGLNFVALLTMVFLLSTRGDSLSYAIPQTMIAIMIVLFGICIRYFFGAQRKEYATSLAISSTMLFTLAMLQIVNGVVVPFSGVYATFAFVAIILTIAALSHMKIHAKATFFTCTALLTIFSFFPFENSIEWKALSFLFFIATCTGLVMTLTYTPRRVKYYT